MGTLKIQAKAGGYPWADLRDLPNFSTVDDAQLWLQQHNAEKLQLDGMSFRVMPAEFPCEFMVQLVRNGG